MLKLQQKFVRFCYNNSDYAECGNSITTTMSYTFIYN